MGESLAQENGGMPMVKPKVVCQIAFVEWTDARPRHCTLSVCAMARSRRKWLRNLNLAKLGLKTWHQLRSARVNTPKRKRRRLTRN
jgi:hypothetical protein